MKRASVLLLVAALSGCGGCDTPPATAITECQQAQVVPGVARTDILFVIDDSGSMSQEQDALQRNFGTFVQELESSVIRNEFQIGVTTTSVERVEDSGTPPVITVLDTFGTDDVAPGTPAPNGGRRYPAGTLIAVDQATVTPDDPATPANESDDPATTVDESTLGRYVVDAGGAYAGPRILSSGSPTLDVDFRTNALVGIYGSAKEEGLRAARLALQDRIADSRNAGFLRAGARLAVIIVTDEDDCSDPQRQISFPASNCRDDASKARLEPLQSYVDFFRGRIGGELRDVVVAVIAGVDGSGSPAECTGNSTSAAERADRYKDFVDQLAAAGGTSLIASICSDFASTLRQIAGLIEPGQTMEIDGAPADWRMLSVRVQKRTGETVPCDPFVHEGEGDPAGADAIFHDPDAQTGRPATITFQNDCHLEQGDEVALDVLCAR